MKKFCANEGKEVEVINVYADAERSINKMTFNAIRNIVMYRMGINESDLNSQSIKSSNRVAARLLEKRSKNIFASIPSTLTVKSSITANCVRAFSR